MKKILFMIAAALIMLPQFSYSTKIKLNRFYPHKTLQKKKIHPLEKYFNKTPKRINKSNKLLCLLVDFQQDDDPNTTGNGKFLSAADSINYPVTFAKPPHDYNFYLEQLRALKYYYIAASFGAFNLQYELYPKHNKTAYTLPHPMAYYNPANASTELMLSRFEEYFKDVFMEADKDDEINFADYGHFMILHAGSDWQHDVMGDTPCDIPSFFIRMAEGKEVWVDNHSVSINYACNVPEMITQDIQIYSSDTSDYTEIYGYGVINGVMQHEFGHSLGFVDLYSTTTNRPGVGFYDIMDSGGSGLVGFAKQDTVYFIEGGLPVLPSAWHRILAWEDNFRERGILKDITSYNFDEDITLEPAEKKIEGLGAINPYFIKIPLTDKEYILLENRQVDPDGDGGAAIKTTHDKRVILYPTHNNSDPSDTLATYEYDYLLPGWMTAENRAIGGGILAWHIDDKIIYDDGNYDANTVNANYLHRGIRLIEADNMQDIGNVESSYWLGTAYDPYYRYKPVLDNGVFIRWDDQVTPGGVETGIFNDELSSSSKPALTTNAGSSSIYSIYDISSYPVSDFAERSMTFKFGINFFDDTKTLQIADKEIKSVGPLNKTSFLANEDAEFPIVNDDGLTMAYFTNGQWITMDSYDYKNVSSITLNDVDSDGEKEYLIAHENKLEILNHQLLQSITYPDTIQNRPIYLNDYDKFVVSSKNAVYIGEDSLLISNAKCYYNKESVIVYADGKIKFINPQNLDDSVEFSIPNSDEKNDVVSFVDTLNSANSASYLFNGNGVLYKITRQGLTKLFLLSEYTTQKPSQIALAKAPNGSVYLIFGADNRIFAVSTTGNLLPHFPVLMDDNKVLAYSYFKIIKMFGNPYIFAPLENESVTVYDFNGIKHQELAYVPLQISSEPDYYYSKGLSELFFLSKYGDDKILISSRHEDDNSIIWAGRRNKSFYESHIDTYSPVISNFDAYVFPNPASGEEVRFRVFNAESDISFSVYNIAGDKICKKEYKNTSESYQEIRYDISKYASGVYFAIIKSKKQIKKIPFAIEK